MSSCYWTEPAQLHPWFRPATLKRKLPTMFPRSESPSPVDEYGSDTRIKRQRHITLEQIRSKKRKLPSSPPSPVEDVGDALFLKRQRCTMLEREIESLSLTPPTQATAVPHVARQPAPPASAAPAHTPGLSPSSQWPQAAPPLSSSPLSLNTPASVHTPTSTPPIDTIADIKMHSSSWYEPEKDRTSLSLSCLVSTNFCCTNAAADVEIFVRATRSPRLRMYNRNHHYRSGRGVV
jgi:hypothetical protein